MRISSVKVLLLLGIAIIALLILPGLASAQRLKPIPHPIGVLLQPPAQPNTASSASPWTPLTHQPKFLLDGASVPILLTDGTVLIQDSGFPDWYRLTPDKTGSYVNGTWTKIASLPATYSPLYHSSAVLPDGRLIIEGGEDLLSVNRTEFVSTWSAQGSIYDPIANTWTPIAPPKFFGGFGPFLQTIGDAQSVILADGTYMQADCCTTDEALLDPTTLTWRRTGSGKFDVNDEEGWTLLPNNQVLTVDTYASSYDPTGTNSELYTHTTGSWSSAGSTIMQLWDSAADCGGEMNATFELGPGVLRPDGTVFYTGANSCGAGHTTIFNSNNGKWRAGPDFPDGLDIADGPAALEPNGKVLMMASPGFSNPPSSFFEWDGSKLTTVPATPNAPFEPSFVGNMLVLPTGQILLTDFSNDIEIYTPAGSHPKNLEPVVESAPVFVSAGQTYQIFGVGFNGVSQGAAYGDDVQSATNYPLVRVTNTVNGHVSYWRTHDPSSMAVASKARVSTHFEVPAGQKSGVFELQIVANGIASQPVFVAVQ